MTLNFLPLPLFIVFLSALSIELIYTAIKRKDIDRKGLIVLCYLTSVSSIIFIAIRILKEKTDLYELYPDVFFGIIVFLLCLIFMQFLYLCVTHKGNAKSKRALRFILSFMLICVLSIIIIIYI